MKTALTQKEEEILADINQFVDKDYEGIDFKSSRNAPSKLSRG